MSDNADSFDDLGLIWGADAIARFIGCDRRRTFYLLEKGELPGAKKIGGRWCISRQRLRQIFS